MKKLTYQQTRLPNFMTRQVTNRHSDTRSGSSGIDAYENESLTLFDLSSHQRAKESIEFGLKMRDRHFHVFVVGEDRSGRMTATLSFLKNHVKTMTAPPDWVYLNNFDMTHKPLPFSLPAGEGKVLEERMLSLLNDIHTLINKIINQPHFMRQVDTLSSGVQHDIERDLVHLHGYARKKGFQIEQGNDGFGIESIKDNYSPSDLRLVRDRVNKFSIQANLASQTVQNKIFELRKELVEKTIRPLLQKFRQKFGSILGEWIDIFHADILENIDNFINPDEEPQAKLSPDLKERYAVNLFVDNSNTKHPRVFLEANPSFESIFGSIKYRTNALNGVVETNFNMIRPGALHLANGGILVLRGDSLAKDQDLWDALKAAMRDNRIRTYEKHRENSLPLWDAPEPKSIPMDVQIFVIASPFWYYNVFFQDPDFKSYFKIKADIDPDMPATPENIQIYQQLIRQNAKNITDRQISQEALDYIVSYSSRWVGHRERLCARFELIGDILEEASVMTNPNEEITANCIRSVITQRRYRNARQEDRNHEEFERRLILIDTEGKKVGQVNGLTVLSLGDHTYGLPSRISARSYVGREDGIVNIERLVEMAGPIQQKGAMIVEGFLKGIFAQKFPLSCSCSITFEQNYSDIEGDSASMAELVSILSALSSVPLKQNIAITGSVNQFGFAQAVGGVHYKIEGFHRLCKARGLDGSHGVIIPASNMINLTLRDDVAADIRDKKFHVWAVDSIFEAIELLTDHASGIKINKTGEMQETFGKGSVFDKAFKTLDKYHKILKKSE